MKKQHEEGWPHTDTYCVELRPCPSHFLPSASICQRPPDTPTQPRTRHSTADQSSSHSAFHSKFNHMMFSL
ncbi:hypothetical protein QQF64_016398 [Cirrhinus molitorella]|uniref:Uncharacterized protein n=1 Tax=Cirrhinus molitorella TaxID=172907 RepID=A0ABR3LQZ2_9TELE